MQKMCCGIVYHSLFPFAKCEQESIIFESCLLSLTGLGYVTDLKLLCPTIIVWLKSLMFNSMITLHCISTLLWISDLMV